MKISLWLSLGTILCAGILAVQNSAAPIVTMRFFLWNFETSLIYTVLGAAGIGMLLILSLWIPRAIHASFRAKILMKEVELLQKELKDRAGDSKKKA